jgi:hypothetical protein
VPVLEGVKAPKRSNCTHIAVNWVSDVLLMSAWLFLQAGEAMLHGTLQVLNMLLLQHTARPALLTTVYHITLHTHCQAHVHAASRAHPKSSVHSSVSCASYRPAVLLL